MSGISSNTDRLQQVDDYVRGCTWQLKKIKTISRFHNLVFERRQHSSMLDITSFTDNKDWRFRRTDSCSHYNYINIIYAASPFYLLTISYDIHTWDSVWRQDLKIMISVERKSNLRYLQANNKIQFCFTCWQKILSKIIDLSHQKGENKIKWTEQYVLLFFR